MFGDFPAPKAACRNSACSAARCCYPGDQLQESPRRGAEGSESSIEVLPGRQPMSWGWEFAGSNMARGVCSWKVALQQMAFFLCKIRIYGRFKNPLRLRFGCQAFSQLLRPLEDNINALRSSKAKTQKALEVRFSLGCRLL